MNHEEDEERQGQRQEMLMNPSPHWAGFEKPDHLENFRQSGSAGLDGVSKVGRSQVKPDDSEKALFEIVRSVAGDDLLRKIYINDVGNPSTIEHDGYSLTTSDTCNAWNAWRLSQYLEDGMSVTEIGPGFGGLCAMLHRIYPSMTFKLIDLPYQRILQRYYLENTVGLDRVQWIEPEDARKCDAVINIRSMMEMTKEQVNGYFDLIQNTMKPDWFYCVNRYEKKGILLKEYPFADDWQIHVSMPLPWQYHIHEYMLKRGGSGFRKHLDGMFPYKTGGAWIVIDPGKNLLAVKRDINTHIYLS